MQKGKPLSWRHWVAGVALLLLGSYLNCVSQASIDKFRPNYDASRVLPDLGFAVLPQIPYTIIIDLSAYLMVGIVVIALWVSHGHFLNMALFIVLQQLGCIFVLRASSILLTLLPTPLPGCTSTGLAYPVLWRAVRLLIGIDRTCADVFFSGHAANMTLALLAWHCFVQFPRGWRRWLLVLITTITVFFCLLLIITRFHYTIDVVVGVFVASAVWYGWSVLDTNMDFIQQRIQNQNSESFINDSFRCV